MIYTKNFKFNYLLKLFYLIFENKYKKNLFQS